MRFLFLSYSSSLISTQNCETLCIYLILYILAIEILWQDIVEMADLATDGN